MSRVRSMLKNPSQFTYKHLVEVFDKVSSQVRATDLVLQFKNLSHFCDKCGSCCRQTSPILLDVCDIPKMASYLQMSTVDFSLQYVHADGENFYFKYDRPCRFLKDNICSIYPARPLVCEQYPMNNMSVKLEDGSISGAVIANYAEFCRMPIEVSAHRITAELLKEIIPHSLADKLGNRMKEIYEKVKRSHPEANEIELARLCVDAARRGVVK